MAISGKVVTYKRGNRTAVIDPATALWAARMLIGEGYKGGKGAAVLWATMNRYMDAGHNFETYKNLIRAFSQPINDAWLPGGQLYERFKDSKQPVYVRATSDAAVQRRRRIRAMQWSDMPIAVQQIVGKFMIGKLPYPAGFRGKRINNFASYEGVSENRPGGIWYGGEYFFEDIPSKGKIAINSNSIQYPAQNNGSGGGGLLIAAGILVALAFKKG